MKDVFSERELVDLEYFIQDMAIKTGADSHSFAVTNGCATYYLYLDEFEQRTCLFKPSYFGRNPKGNWIAVDFVIGKNGYCVLGSVRNIDPSVAKNSSNYRDFYKRYVGTYWKFDVPHDFFDYMNESKTSARKSLRESDDITKLMKAIYKFLKKYGDYYFYEGVIHHYSWELSNNVILGEYDFNGVAINQTVKIYLSENYDGFYIERGYLNKGQINDIKFADTYTSSIEEMLDDVDYVCSCINYELLSIAPSKHSK